MSWISFMPSVRPAWTNSRLRSDKNSARVSRAGAGHDTTPTAWPSAVGVVSWPAPARLTRAEFLSLRNREFVQAGRTLGMKDIQLILGEILPNSLPPVIVYASVVMAVSILLESALAFLRLSDPNVASWGNLIGLGRDVLRVQWYVSAIPASPFSSPCSRYRWSARASTMRSIRG